MPALSPSLISKLRQVAEAPPPAALEKCDFCGKTISPEHRHFADLGTMRFLCACEMCFLTQAERGVFKPLPQRYLFLEKFNMPEALWQELMIPVEMAFFVFHSARNKTMAFYPGPTGATESQLSLGSFGKSSKSSTRFCRSWEKMWKRCSSTEPANRTNIISFPSTVVMNSSARCELPGREFPAAKRRSKLSAASFEN